MRLLSLFRQQVLRNPALKKLMGQDMAVPASSVAADPKLETETATFALS